MHCEQRAVALPLGPRYEDSVLTLAPHGAQNAVPAISDRSYLRGGSGICALEAYHGGAVRMQLLQNSSAIIQPWGVDALTITQVCCPIAPSLRHPLCVLGSPHNRPCLFSARFFYMHCSNQPARLNLFTTFLVLFAARICYSHTLHTSLVAALVLCGLWALKFQVAEASLHADPACKPMSCVPCAENLGAARLGGARQ